MTKSPLLVLLLLIFLTCTGCMPFRIDGPYKGQIIDAQTRQPIEGVVVDTTWHKLYPNVAGSSSSYYDTRETLTDKNGEFRIYGMGLLIFSFIDKASIIIFKAGYSEEAGPWVAYDKENIWQFKGMVTRDGGKLVVRLKKLTMEERRKRIGPSSPLDAPNSKLKLLHTEINKEMMEIGYPASTLYALE